MSVPIAEHGHVVGLCGWDGSNWEKILLDLTKRILVVIDAQNTSLEVEQKTPDDLLSGQHHFDGNLWRKSNLLWGYNDRWAENLDYPLVGTGSVKNSTPVPEGYVYVAQIVSIKNMTRTATTHRISFFTSTGTDVTAVVTTGNPTYVPTCWNGGVVLKQGDYVQVSCSSGVADDVIQAGVFGYMMKVNM